MFLNSDLIFCENFYICSRIGELPEWSNGADSKSVELLMWFRGFESLALRQSPAY